MKVLKFGGTSVGMPVRMKAVAKIICDGNQKNQKAAVRPEYIYFD